jgi:hypothetical protein
MKREVSISILSCHISNVHSTVSFFQDSHSPIRPFTVQVSLESESPGMTRLFFRFLFCYIVSNLIWKLRSWWVLPVERGCLLLGTWSILWSIQRSVFPILRFVFPTGFTNEIDYWSLFIILYHWPIYWKICFILFVRLSFPYCLWGWVIPNS